MIDLRSDVHAPPTDEMWDAMRSAELGWATVGEDPSVNELQERVAGLLGKEAGLWVPTCGMANLVALLTIAPRGSTVVLEASSHVLTSEAMGIEEVAGLEPWSLWAEDGRLHPVEVEEAIVETRALMLVLENTHTRAGGTVLSPELTAELAAAAQRHGAYVHLDGARLFNAAVASGVPAAQIARHADTVTICLSKGLGCPLGALVAGSSELMRRARRYKHLFGGAMRQAGIVAAAGVYALDHHVDRLAEDHTRAKRLADGLAAAGMPVQPENVETNFVQIDVEPLGLTAADALERLHQVGVGLSATVHPTRLRAVTHLDVSDDDIDRAIDLVPEALGVLARA